jgi:pimeloyl-[acyl-carrier protein] methyl ester esterase
MSAAEGDRDGCGPLPRQGAGFPAALEARARHSLRFVRADVVLLPGLHGSRALFSSFVALAPAWANCLPLALPTVGGQSFDELVDAILPELRSLEGFVLLGESFSGPIAARLSARLGQKVALLVLCNPVVEMSVRVPEGFLASIAASSWMPAWGASMALSGGDMAVVRAALDEVRALPKGILAQRLAAVYSATEEDLASHLAPPFLTILGTSDSLVPPPRSRAFFSRVPESTVAEIEGPHLIVQTRPVEVWAAISEEFETAA